MPPRRFPLSLVAALLAAPSSLVAADPALVLVISIDQFRADYLTRFRPHFVADGFNLLLERGANFTDCHYRHALTKTGPGHAVILSGVHANVHGIIANDWIDRESLQRVNCVGDASAAIVGAPPPLSLARMPGKDLDPGGSPRRFLATTVGDELKLARAGRPKVIAISSKDRSAILLGGKLADAAYWMDRGQMVTSTYYRHELPAWVKAFNDAGRTDAYFGRSWERLLPASAYEAIQGADDAPGESEEWGLGRTFPKIVNGGESKLSPLFYEAFECSPFKSEVLAEFAHAVMEHEQLGQRGVTDLLAVSFSTNDTVGHNYGPDSHEVMDMALRTDRLLAALFRFIDARVGLQKCTIVLTADHGAAPLPERVRALRPDFSAGRIDNPKAVAVSEAALERAFGLLPEERGWLVPDAGALVFTPGVLASKEISPAAAQAIVRDALLTLEFVARAFTRTELESGEFRAGDGEAEAMALSFHAARSGDVFFQFKPYWVDRKSGTNHGTPYNYDTHVPLLWFGVGVTRGSYTRRVGVDDIAPTLSRILGLPAPPQARGRNLF